MVLPTSMTPSGPDSFSEPSISSSDDSTHSFKLFLDLITPTEFSKLLRARVRHLLKTWPPQSASTISAGSPSSSTHSKHSCPSVESVRAFAAFFRTQDSPGPSPIDLAASTSLQALHHHLLALQTLLSFLSGRELQDIVRARLSEGGRDRSVAVQGLMDIMRSAGNDEVVKGSNDKGVESVIVEDSRIASGGEQTEEGDEPMGSTGQVPLSSSSVGKRKMHAKYRDGTEIGLNGGEPPPKKRQRMENSDIEGDTTTSQSHLQSIYAPFLPSHPMALITAPLRSDSNVVDPHRTYAQKGSDSTQMEGKPQALVKSQSTTDALLNPDSVLDRSADLDSGEFARAYSNHDAKTSKKNSQDSDEEDEGLVVTLIDEDLSHPNPGLQPPVSSLLTGEPLTAQTEPVPSDAASVATAFSSVPATDLKSGGPSSLPPPSDAETGPGPGVSRAEWNRKRFRAALGLPPKEPEKDAEDGKDFNADLKAYPIHEQQPHPDNNSPSNLVPGASESGGINSVSENCIISLSHDSSVDSAHVHSSVSSPPLPDVHAPRSPSPSLNGSDLDDPPSPPGPVLRAVDWASKVVPVPVTTEMEVDELEEQDGSDDTVTLGNGPVFDMNRNSKDGMKPGSSVFTKSFSYQHTQMIAWPDVEAENGDNPMWDDGDEEAFDNGNDVVADATQNQPPSGSRSGRKLFIRLPARGSGKGGETGITSTGTDVSASGSVSASPAPPSPSFHVPPSSKKGGVSCDERAQVGVASLTRHIDLPTVATASGKEVERGLKVEQAKIQSPLLTGPSSIPAPATGPNSVTSTPSSLLQPQSQVASTSHTSSISPNPLQHGQHPLHGHHPQPYPPPHPQAHAHGHPFPGPWFGAMFYVPFRGPPHLRTHPHAQPPHATHHHPHPHPHMLSQAAMQSQSSLTKPQNSLTPGPSKQSPGSPGSPRGAANEKASGPSSGLASGSGSAPVPPAASGSSDSTPSVAPPEGPKRIFKRRSSADPGDSSLSSVANGEDGDPNVTYTDDVGVKETPLIKRRCFNCCAVQAPSWRKSKINAGKILCNKCGIYESTHMTARPLKTRPRRSNGEGGPTKKRKSSKKAISIQLPL